MTHTKNYKIMKITISQRQAIKKALSGENRSISKGMSSNSAGFGTRTPIEVIPGKGKPSLLGQPYLKTQFRNGAFQKTLYTPSTLHVTVGARWLENAI